jgi:Conjugal transfer protein TraD
MTEVMNGKLEQIAKKKQDLAKLERLIKEKEKQKEQKKKIKTSIEIGNLASKANIDTIDRNILLGAFIEISQRCQNDECLEVWKKNARIFEKNSESNREDLLSISFKSEIPDYVKSKLKNQKFRWNKFRKEFYGYANKQELESMLNGLEYVIEDIP